jgi:sulfite reductase beta subunit-like hemoprotein
MSPRRGVVHISGCEKRCAYRGSADITAIGESGSYQVLRLGQPSRTGVSGPQLAKVISDLARLYELA